MRPLIDGDILRYELGFACETGWREISQSDEELPPWDYVVQNLHQRIDNICALTGATEKPVIYLTEGKTFRDNIAVTKPYKGSRKPNKPWHFGNLSAYIKSEWPIRMEPGFEADDLMTVDHIADPDTIICSRDKDLRQVPGWFYSWELGNQPSYGPLEVTKEGELHWDADKKKLTGNGLAFFYAQLLMGDPVDNIPGLPKCGPVRAWNLLTHNETDPTPDMQHPMDEVAQEYERVIGEGWEAYLLEQGRLLWMTRRLHEDGSPVLWEIGMEE